MSRREQEQYPVNESDFQHAYRAASIVDNPHLREKERQELKRRRERIGKREDWAPFSLRSASDASGVSRHRRRVSRRKPHRKKSHRRKSHRRKSHRRKSHRRRNSKRKTHYKY